jgi:CrcB protein
VKKHYINTIWVALGGSIGAIFRYSFSFLHNYTPYMTMTVNLIGCFLLGMITSFFILKIKGEWLKLFLGTGFCGGFTTMSTFSMEITHQALSHALLYSLITIIGGISLAFLGSKIINSTLPKEED